jgi:serine/threonine protein kinase
MASQLPPNAASAAGKGDVVFCGEAPREEFSQPLKDVDANTLMQSAAGPPIDRVRLHVANAAFQVAFAFGDVLEDDKKQYVCRFAVPDPVEQVRYLLHNHRAFKAHVRHCFMKIDKADAQGVHALKQIFAERIGIPSECFGPTTELDVERWDFSGTGTPTEFGIFKMLKYHLVEYSRTLTGMEEIPYKTVDAAGYTILRDLGAGAQGTAKLAKDMQGNQICIKCYPKEKMKAGSVVDLMHEFVVLKRLECEVIATATEIFQDEAKVCLVGECYHGGDFVTLRERAIAQGVEMTRDWWQEMFRQVFNGLAFIHSNAMIHCDIKEPNLMIKTPSFSQPQVVIIDLGVASCMARENSLNGTPGYVPPETLQAKMWFPKGDLFSFGVVIMQLLTDRVPTDNSPFTGIFTQGCLNVRDVFAATIQRDPPLELMPREYPLLTALVGKLLQKDRRARPNAAQALADPWFANADEEIEVEMGRPASLQQKFVRACNAVSPKNVDFHAACTDPSFWGTIKIAAG